MDEKKTNPSSSVNNIKICLECKLVFTDIYKYVEHLEELSHKQRVMHERYGFRALHSNVTPSNLTKHKEEKNKETSELFICEYCNTVITGALNYDFHKMGKKHQRNVNRATDSEKVKKEKVLQDADYREEGDDFPHDIEFSDMDFYMEPYSKTRTCAEPSKQCITTGGYNRRENMRECSLNMPSLAVAGSSKSKLLLPYISEKMKFTDPYPSLRYEHNRRENMHECSLDMPSLAVAGSSKSKLSLPYISEEMKFTDPYPSLRNEKSRPKSLSTPMETELASMREQKRENLKRIQENYKHSIVILTDNKDAEEGEACTIFCTECSDSFDNPESAEEHFKSQKH